MDNPELTHDVVVDAIVSQLKTFAHVLAIWEGGAVAFGRSDKWSDIDLYIVVDDDAVERTFNDVEASLLGLSPIKQKFDIGQTSYEGVSQAFYRLENASEYLLIDLAVMKSSAPDKFLEPEIHGNIVFHLNKGSVIPSKPIDRQEFSNRLVKRFERLGERRRLFTIFVHKEINRGNFLEAFDAYRLIIYEMIVELLRMKYYAFHYDFRLRYVYHELPAADIVRLERLIKIRDIDDLRTKMDEAEEWLDDLMMELGQADIEEMLKTHMCL